MFIDDLRKFNRFYTQRIGVLDWGHLGTPFSLAEARLLYELQQGPATPAQLRDRLVLDGGYLSRMVTGFETQGLVQKRPSSDRRQFLLELTAKGKAAHGDLDARAKAAVEHLTHDLTPNQKAELTGSMKKIQALLGGPTPAPVLELRQHQPGDMGWVVEQHGAIYAREFGWDSRFEALVARITGEFLESFDPAKDRCWIAELDQTRVGSVFVVNKGGGVAQLRLLLVDARARGLGLGRRLVAEAESFAREAGYRRITLWTNDVLHSARKIYENAGFKITQEETHRDFGPEMIGQMWEKSLT